MMVTLSKRGRRKSSPAPQKTFMTPEAVAGNNGIQMPSCWRRQTFIRIPSRHFLPTNRDQRRGARQIMQFLVLDVIPSGHGASHLAAQANRAGTRALTETLSSAHFGAGER